MGQDDEEKGKDEAAAIDDVGANAPAAVTKEDGGGRPAKGGGNGRQLAHLLLPLQPLPDQLVVTLFDQFDAVAGRVAEVE